MKKSILSLATLVFASQVMLAQSKMITGRVLDDKGAPVIGASVTTSDDKLSTFTDENGSFALEIPKGVSNVLVIDNFGTKETVDASSKTELGDIKMGLTQLTGVVVTGYRNVSKEKYNGAADRIDAKHIEKFPATNITKAIEGAAPGIQIATASGAPGSSATVRIRGIGSINGNTAPLYVVDGAPFAGDINSINANDIESINILKDAVATSLYGSRGANGVIVITTKRGRNVDGKPVMSVNMNYGIINRAFPDYDYIRDAGEYSEVALDAYTNNILATNGVSRSDARKVALGLASLGPNTPLFANLGGYNPFGVPEAQLFDSLTGKIRSGNTLRYQDDWMKLSEQRGSRQEINSSISGNANEGKTDYYFSLGYTKEKGFLIRSEFDRFNALAKVNTRVNSWLSMGLTANFAQSTEGFSWASSSNSGNPMFVGRSTAPIFPVYFYDSLGNRQVDPVTGLDKYDWGALSSDNLNEANSSMGDRPGNPGNVIGSIMLDHDRSKNLNISLIPYINIQLTKDLTFNTMFNYMYRHLYGTYSGNPFYGTTTKGYVEKYTSGLQNYTFRQQLNYRKVLNDKHTFDAFLAHENYDIAYNYFSSRANGIPFYGNNNTYGTNTPLPGDSYDDVHRMEHYTASVQYDYDGMASIEAVFKRDGNSRFAPESRWGNFFAVGASANMKKFAFAEGIDMLDRWRVKVSYGTQGNEALGSYYVWQTLYDYKTVDGVTYVSPATLGNRQLTWEKQKQLNIGTEFSMFKNRLNAEVNYFHRTNADQLTNLPIPGSTGFSSFPINALTSVTYGVEAQVSMDILRTEKVNWNMLINATHYDNRITKMHPQQDSIKGSQLKTVGTSTFDFWLVEHAGIINFDNFQEIADGDSTQLGMELYYSYDSTGNLIKTTNYNDALNKRRIIAGSAIPTLIGNINNTVTFGNFDLSVMLTYGLGGKAYDAIYQDLMGPGKWGENWHRDAKNAWSYENPNSAIPRVQMNEEVNIARSSTRFLIDASYLNVRNISIGYTLPERWSNRARLSNTRIYSQMDNVWLFSRRQGFNPQQSISGDLGANSYTYSPNRIITLGVRFNLQ